MPIITQQAPLPTTESARQPDKVVAEPQIPTTEATNSEANQKLSPQYAMLAKREKAIRSETQRLKAERAEFEAQKVSKSSDFMPKAKLAEQLRSDSLGFFNELGLTTDEVANLLLNQRPEDAAYRRLQAELQATREETNKISKQFEEREQEQYTQAVNQIRAEVKTMVAQDENFETIRAMQMEDAVVELIEETFKTDGILLGAEEAAKEVEDHLVEEAMKFTQLNKIKQRMMPTEEIPGAPKLEARLSQQQQPIKTLNHAATVITSKPMNARDRRDRAVKAFLGQLKD